MRRSWLGWTVLGFAALLLGGEGFARWGLGLGTPPLSETHPRLEYRFRPHQDIRRFGNRVTINGQGMRSEPMTPRPVHGQRRILVFGDSVVFGGSQLDQSQIGTELMRAALTPEGAQEVGNVSAGSWGPGNWRAWAETEGFLGATDVVLVISSHDARDNPTFAPLDPQTHPSHNPPSALIELLQRYALPWISARVPWMDAFVPHPGPPPLSGDPAIDDPGSPQALKRGLSDLEAFVREARSSGARLSAVQFWERSEVTSGLPLAEHNDIETVLHRLGVPTVQAGPRFRTCARLKHLKPEELFVDVIHPFTADGQACLASVLSDALEKGDPRQTPAIPNGHQHR